MQTAVKAGRTPHYQRQGGRAPHSRCRYAHKPVTAKSQLRTFRQSVRSGPSIPCNLHTFISRGSSPRPTTLSGRPRTPGTDRFIVGTNISWVLVCLDRTRFHSFGTPTAVYEAFVEHYLPLETQRSSNRSRSFALMPRRTRLAGFGIHLPPPLYYLSGVTALFRPIRFGLRSVRPPTPRGPQGANTTVTTSQKQKAVLHSGIEAFPSRPAPRFRSVLTSALQAHAGERPVDHNQCRQRVVDRRSRISPSPQLHRDVTYV